MGRDGAEQFFAFHQTMRRAATTTLRESARPAPLGPDPCRNQLSETAPALRTGYSAMSSVRTLLSLLLPHPVDLRERRGRSFLQSRNHGLCHQHNGRTTCDRREQRVRKVHCEVGWYLGASLVRRHVGVNQWGRSVISAEENFAPIFSGVVRAAPETACALTSPRDTLQERT